uniref:Uncharacterized protein n=1 Tax=Solanum lycopersicum TaxID=4081 RepID=A0A3Q7I2Q9_SOLLC
MILKSDHVCSDSDFGGLGMLVKQLTDKACNHIHLFISSLALADLVKMYKSPDNAKKYIADESILADLSHELELSMEPIDFAGFSLMSTVCDFTGAVLKEIGRSAEIDR